MAVPQDFQRLGQFRQFEDITGFGRLAMREKSIE